MKKYFLWIAAILSVGIGGAVTAQQIGHIGNGYIEEGNLLRSGNIIKTVTMSNRGQNADTCRKACDADSDCNAFSYVQAAANKKPVCYMRMIALPNNANRNHGYSQVVSGTKVSYLTDIHKIAPFANNVIKNAAEIRRFATMSNDPVACSDACYRDGKCNSYTYAPKGALDPKVPMCVLNSNTGQRASAAGMMSGVKGDVGRKMLNPALNLDVKPRPIIKPRADFPSIKAPIVNPDNKVPGQLSDDDTPEKFSGEMLDPQS